MVGLSFDAISAFLFQIPIVITLIPLFIFKVVVYIVVYIPEFMQHILSALNIHVVATPSVEAV